jgi:hypothetical protein
MSELRSTRKARGLGPDKATIVEAAICLAIASHLAFLAAPKSKIQFNGVGGLRTHISLTRIGVLYAAYMPRCAFPGDRERGAND